uniref:Transposase n=1 Tax=Macrostomum lignano TaxID=282301 RepID=A0A1I8GZC0_9PLAT
MYDLERGLNAYKYKWSGTDPEPTSSPREKAPKRKLCSRLPEATRRRGRVLTITGRQEVKETIARADQINC